MFTTHGQDAVKAAPDYFGSFQYEEPGFAYRRETDQTDINSDDYGTTIALPRYVARVIDDVIPGARLVSFSAEKWFGLQDEWIIQKPASS